MKKIFCILLSVIIAISLVSCQKLSEEPTSEITSETLTETTTELEEITYKEGFGNEAGTFSSKMKEFPNSYMKEISGGGTLKDVSYVYKSSSKKAKVYLPPNYSDNEEYNILYLVGGGRSDYDAFFECNADTENTYQLKNMLDHAIINNDIDPMIVVSLEFYPDDKREMNINNIDSLLDNFVDEMKTAIIPAVESEYSTYSKSTSKSDIVASRKHRAFGGFSQGGNTTWIMLAKCTEYFYYYVSMSGGDFKDYVPQYSGSVPEMLRETLKETGIAPNEYFLYCANGTEDYTKSNVDTFISKLELEENQDVFTFTDKDKSKGNVTYKVMNGAHHYYTSAYQYILNATIAFWNV